MLEAAADPRSASPDFASRRQIALDRIAELIAQYEDHARRAWRNYYVVQSLTIGLAAITPCLIVLAKESPNNGLLNWLQLFFPAIAAVAAGLSHVFRWREDGVRYTSLVEAIRSQLWHYQTRSGELNVSLSEDQALDRLVVNVDNLIQASVQRWTAAQLAEGTSAGEAPRPAAAR